MLINLTRKRTWVPDFLGNDQAPPETQFTVHYTKPNALQREAFQRVVVDPKTGGRHTEYDVQAIMTECGVTLETFYVAEGDKQREVKTGLELSKLPDDYCALLTNRTIIKIMSIDISEETLKNSAGASGAVSKDGPTSSEAPGTTPRSS